MVQQGDRQVCAMTSCSSRPDRFRSSALVRSGQPGLGLPELQHEVDLLTDQQAGR